MSWPFSGLIKLAVSMLLPVIPKERNSRMAAAMALIRLSEALFFEK